MKTRTVRKVWTVWKGISGWRVKHKTHHVPQYVFRSLASVLDWIKQNHEYYENLRPAK